MPDLNSVATQFSQWLANAMRAAGLDIDRQMGGGRKALAEATGVSMSTVGRWLEGRSVPSPEYFESIAAAVNVPPFEMLVACGILTAPQAPAKGQPVPKDINVVPLAARPHRDTAHTDPEQPDNPDRMPPQDLSAEQSVLGGMMLSKDAIADVLEVLKPADYYRPAHELIHSAIVDLYGRGEPADPITVAGELTKRGELQQVGGPGYLHTLVKCVPTAANAEYYAEIVHQRAVLRHLVEAGTRIAGMGYAPQGDIDELLRAAQAELLAVTEQRSSEGSTPDPLAYVMEGALDDMERVGSDGSPEGASIARAIPTGFANLDALLGGLRPGTLTVIASRPSIGRTTLISDFARTAAIHNNLPTVVFTVEESRNEFALRVTSAEARVARHHVRAGHMTDDDWTRTARRMPDITNAPLYIDAPPRLTVAEAAEKSRRLAKSSDIKLIIIDGIQSLRPEKRSDLREREVGDIARDLKALARELDVPVVATAQLNRGPEQRPDRRPQLDELRESGAITFEADTIILLHREDAHDKLSPRAGEADLIVAKHRHGPTATILVAFQGHYGRFVDMAPDN